MLAEADEAGSCGEGGGWGGKRRRGGEQGKERKGQEGLSRMVMSKWGIWN